jgi:hypothetical protein
MASVAAPYGLRPVNLIGGQPYAGSTRMFKIANAYAANIFYGQPVASNGNGFIQADTSTTALPATGVVGVFMGCTYTDPSLKIKVFKQYWPTGTIATDAEAYVVDDPDVVMQVQADEAVAQTALGANIALVTSAGSTSTGNSTTAADGSSIAASATLPLRIVGFVDAPDSVAGDAYTDLLVKWNMPSTNGSAIIGGHSYMNPLGVA